MTESPLKTPRLRIEVGRHYDRSEKEDQVLIKIAAKPGFAAFWQSLAPTNLPGYELIRHTPLEPFARMANFWFLPVTAMLAPDGVRIDMQPDSKEQPKAGHNNDHTTKDTAKPTDLPITDLDWKNI